jgi:2-keto-4-pentenoate hydratase/2-oxohepta-3-ene-1,7-dioic acid hydratase in catechol pathway
VYLVTIDSREVAGRPGVVTADGQILDLVAAPSTLSEAQWIPHSVISILAAGEEGRDRVNRLLEAADSEHGRTRLREAGALLRMSDTRLMAPVRRPGLVLVSGGIVSAPGEPDPVAFIKSPNTVTGHGAEIRVPWSAEEGIECTMMPAVVLGRCLHRAGEADAARAVAGYTVLMDVSRPAPAADASIVDWRRFMDSKQFPGACPVGPSIVTIDGLDAGSALALVTDINGVPGETRRVSLAEVPARLAALSRRYGFRPGDLIGLAPPDPGDAPRRRLRPGDRVRAVLSGHMELEATLAR